MGGDDSLLVILVTRVDRLAAPPPPAKRRQGSPQVYPDHLVVNALGIMLVRQLHTGHDLLAVLDQPTAELQTRCGVVTHQGRFPCRRTWERRVAARPTTLPAPIGCLGRQLVALVQPWRAAGRAVAIATPRCGHAAACGTSGLASRARCRPPASTPRPTGPRRVGTAGSTAGSSIWSRPSPTSGPRWPLP
jgi:hypothetical protein